MLCSELCVYACVRACLCACLPEGGGEYIWIGKGAKGNGEHTHQCNIATFRRKIDFPGVPSAEV